MTNTTKTDPEIGFATKSIKRKSVKRISVAAALVNTRKASFFIGDTEGNKLPVKVVENRIVDTDEQELTPDEIIIPPDGGYGYVIVFTAFMSNMIVDGIVFSFGSLKDSIYNDKRLTLSGGPELDQATLAWVGSFLTGFYLLTGPFVSAVANRFGFRIVAVSGSVISSSAFILSWYLNQNGPQIGLLIVFYGIIGGIGFSCIYVPAVIAVGFYFEKKRAIATGIAICGSGIGNFIFPPLISVLTDKYDWYGAILVLGLMILLCGFLGLLYQPLKPQKARKMSIMTPDDVTDDTPLLIRIKRARDIMKRWDSVIHVGSERKSRSNSEKMEGNESRTDIFFNRATKSTTSVVKRGSPTAFIPSGGDGREMLNKPLMPSSTHIGAGAGELTNFPQALGVLVSIPAKVPTLQGKGFVGLPDLPEMVEEKYRSEGTADPRGNGVNTGSESMNLSKSESLEDIENSKYPALYGNVRIGNSMLTVDEITNPKIIRVSSKVTLNKPIYRDEIMYSGHLLTIPDYANTPMAAIASPDGAPSPWEETEKSTGKGPPLEEQSKTACFSHAYQVVKSMLDFSLFLSPTFIIFAASGMFTMLGLLVPFVYLTDQAQFVLTKQDDIPAKSSLTLLLSLIGAANTVGRILSGWVADRPCINCLILNNGAVTLMGISTVMVPFLGEYFHFIAYSCVFGISMACFASLRSILVVELLGLAKLTNAFGLLLLFQGIASMVATPLAGTIAKLSKDPRDFSMAFYAAGGFLVLSAVMGYPLNRIQKWERKKTDATNH